MHSAFIAAKPPTPFCHAATIAQTPSGLVAAWFGGRKEGSDDCAIWSSKTVNGEWEPPRVVAEEVDQGCGVPLWNPVLCWTGEQLWLFYKAGDKPWYWHGRLSVSLDCGWTWKGEHWPTHILGPDKNPPLVIGKILEWGSSVQTGPSYRQDTWLPRMEWCRTDRQEWGIDSIPTDFYAIQPVLFPGDAGFSRSALLRTPHGFLVESHRQEATALWLHAKQTKLGNPNAAIGGIELPDGRLLLAHNPSKVRRQRTPLVLSVKSEFRDWQQAVALEEGEGEFSYPTVINAIEGRLDIVYTWNRTHIKHAIVELKELD